MKFCRHKPTWDTAHLLQVFLRARLGHTVHRQRLLSTRWQSETPNPQPLCHRLEQRVQNFLWKYWTFPTSFAKTKTTMAKKKCRPIGPPEFIFNTFSKLYVESQLPEMAQFLPCLDVPRSCKLHLHLWKYHDTRIRASTTPLPTPDAVGHEQHIQSFYLELCVKYLKVQGFCDVLSHEQLETADPILGFVVDLCYDKDVVDVTLQSFLSLLPLGAVTFLDVANDLGVELTPKFWMDAFGSIQTLKTIHLDTGTYTFWHAHHGGETCRWIATTGPLSLCHSRLLLQLPSKMTVSIPNLCSISFVFDLS